MSLSIPPLVPQCPDGKLQAPTGKVFHHQAPAALLALIPLSLLIPVILFPAFRTLPIWNTLCALSDQEAPNTLNGTRQKYYKVMDI